MDGLTITVSLAPTEPGPIRLVPIRSTEDNGPFQPLSNRATKVAPGESRSVRVMMMAAFHVHIMGEATRCAFQVSVDADSKSAANFVTMRKPVITGPWEPDFLNPLLVRPGETRLVEVNDGQALHCHEIILMHD
jgi:hypothetical protein